MRRARLLLLATIVAVVTGCTAGETRSVEVAGVAVAGPVCPVETASPDPACAPRPVIGAEIAVRDAAGNVVGRARTDGDGGFSLSLAPGTYRVEPQPVEGLMGTAQAFDLVVEAGEPITDLEVAYDTGIR
jgi:hypothetical protein